VAIDIAIDIAISNCLQLYWIWVIKCG